ncbi:hypothetical protein NQZ68_016757 [Dissostichus eleginoides]|nr:hypothetical protein NQZ68_016757 [Dissostichus eleginoides]
MTFPATSLPRSALLSFSIAVPSNSREEMPSPEEVYFKDSPVPFVLSLLSISLRDGFIAHPADWASLSPARPFSQRYQARTFSTPLSALRRGRSVIVGAALRESQEGRDTSIQSVRETRTGRMGGRQQRLAGNERTKPAALRLLSPPILRCSLGGIWMRQTRENARRGN